MADAPWGSLSRSFACAAMSGRIRAIVRFPLSAELLLRLPRHPDWRYELVDGEAVISPRPHPLHLRRANALPVPDTSVNAEVRGLDLPADRTAVAALLLEVWEVEDPYRSLEAASELLRSEVHRDLDTAQFGAVAVGSGGICAAVLVHKGVSHTPTLSWLTVAREAREQGLATALLSLITSALLDRGVTKLASATSTANLPSLRWHLSRGFQLSGDLVREALYAQSTPIVPPSRPSRRAP